jgi:hypothetical protein
MFRLMAMRGTAEVKTLLIRDGEPLRDFLRHEWHLGEEDELDPDTIEASEAAEADEQTMDIAAAVWGRLDQQQRQIVLSVARQLGGENAAEEVRELLDMRQPW